MKGVLTKQDLFGLWSVLWRLAVFGTILLPLGFALLILLLAFVFVPPLYAVICIIDGRLVLGIGVAVVWLLLLRVSRGLLCRFSEGIEYAGI
jgi:hypothetical protein